MSKFIAKKAYGEFPIAGALFRPCNCPKHISLVFELSQVELMVLSCCWERHFSEFSDNHYYYIYIFKHRLWFDRYYSTVKCLIIHTMNIKWSHLPHLDHWKEEAVNWVLDLNHYNGEWLFGGYHHRNLESFLRKWIRYQRFGWRHWSHQNGQMKN